jgi:hypothetical protein
MKTTKDFDEVEMMRSIRTKLQNKYDKDPTLEKRAPQGGLVTVPEHPDR